ncbi:MAG: hypothetical protein WAO69_08660 [Aestuariivita sp.]|uniref:hypothetical protein n=1 Tax=Aestuariivita sp. TaxID=1872407 RepID=UPI003BB06BBC
MAEAFLHEASGRNRRTMVVLICVYAALIGLYVVLDAAWWILLLVALTTLPALWDLYTDRNSGVRLADGQLEWWSGRGKARMDLSEIDHMRFDTRLDFSVRVSAVTPSKKRIRLPYDALPEHKIFEAACQAHGLKTERHHFSLL